MPGIIAPLTSREQQVLLSLAAGSSNQAIASELVVTLDTVKKHVTHILGKLGAANRTEAVARARALGLISWAPQPTAGGARLPPKMKSPPGGCLRAGDHEERAGPLLTLSRDE